MNVNETYVKTQDIEFENDARNMTAIHYQP